MTRSTRLRSRIPADCSERGTAVRTDSHAAGLPPARCAPPHSTDLQGAGELSLVVP